MIDEITERKLGELMYELELARLANRQLLADLVDLRIENARLNKLLSRMGKESAKEGIR